MSSSLADEFYSQAPRYRTKQRLNEMVVDYMVDRIEEGEKPLEYVYEGFTGCNDTNPDICACATDSDPLCFYCNVEIQPGDLVQSAWHVEDPFENEGYYVTAHKNCDHATSESAR